MSWHQSLAGAHDERDDYEDDGVSHDQERADDFLDRVREKFTSPPVEQPEARDHRDGIAGKVRERNAKRKRGDTYQSLSKRPTD